MLLKPKIRDQLQEIIKPPTAKQQLNFIRDGMLHGRVLRVMADGKAKNVREACQKLWVKHAHNSNEQWLTYQTEELTPDIIRAAYNRYKKRKNKLPSPYYGRDVLISPDKQQV
jgi:hypothetical protein